MKDDIMTYDPRGVGNRWPRPAYGRPETVDIDIGLRQYMLRVYDFANCASSVRMMRGASVVYYS